MWVCGTHRPLEANRQIRRAAELRCPERDLGIIGRGREQGDGGEGRCRAYLGVLLSHAVIDQGGCQLLSGVEYVVLQSSSPPDRHDIGLVSAAHYAVS